VYHRYRKKKRTRTRRKQSTRESELRKKHKSAPASTTEERERELLPSDFFLTPPFSSSTKPIVFHRVRLRVLTDQLLLHPSHRRSAVLVEREPLYTTTCFFAKNFRFVSLFPYLNGKISHDTVSAKRQRRSVFLLAETTIYISSKKTQK
jgi:hypothetical protein